MAYQPIDNPIPLYFNGKKIFGRKRDCKDFKPYFWNRRYCKLSDKCEKRGYYYDFFRGDKITILCTGIDRERWEKIIS